MTNDMAFFFAASLFLILAVPGIAGGDAPRAAGHHGAAPVSATFRA